MPKYKKLYAHGYWNDTRVPFDYMVVCPDSWDEVEDAEDEEIFYYLDGSRALGNHGDFTITKTEEY
jgi:hypothetical protein